jgi:hypothetical protein
MAESNNDVMELLTVSPHVPDSSPVAGRARPKRDVYAVVMFYLYSLGEVSIIVGWLPASTQSM